MGQMMGASVTVSGDFLFSQRTTPLGTITQIGIADFSATVDFNGEAIGASLACMSGLGVPIVASVIGEGGSGGALALGVANSVLMLEFATYSVITPEGCASILWRDGALAPRAAEQLKLLASDALRLGIVDGVVGEPRGGAHRDPDEASTLLREALTRALGELRVMSPAELIDHRYRKFRAMGVTG